MDNSLEGLSSKEVEERVLRGEVNVDVNVKTRSIKQIFYENIVTLFNGINVLLAFLVFYTGSYRNMLFMLVIVFNTTIGIIQEIRSKRMTDRLNIIAGLKATVIRGGQKVEIPINQIVRNDLILLGRGNQIPSDSIVLSGSCDVDESLLTGESKLVKKKVGSNLMSGSFVNSGTVTAEVIHVGAENYAAKISAEAKKYKKVNSEIMNSLNKVIKFVSIIIFPAGIILFLRDYLNSAGEVNDIILSTVAALIGMIPEGLILLTSTVLALSVIRLAQNKVLVQQLYCIEILARVDTLCLDKTGTITTGKMEVIKTESIDDSAISLVDSAFASLVQADETPNETSQAIIDYYAPRKVSTWSSTVAVPFSSEKKWSGSTLSNGHSYVMGAGEFVMGEKFQPLFKENEALFSDARVLLLAKVNGFTEEGEIKGEPRPIGLIAIHDQIRKTAGETIRYFIEQGVDIKVISGDDPLTVSGIAKAVGIPNADDFVDATKLKTNDQLAEAVENHSIFGRVKPEQKKELVIALQKKGHIVAMTGDGVNDTLALKQSDCSVAMAAGSDAARNVSQLVLVNNDFASMPKVVAEGRRAINNLQRSASLFLAKTLLSMSLTLFFIILPWQYPFRPIQMTLISAFTIGIPSFVLALEPNKDRIKGQFLVNVMVKSIPGALVAVLSIIAINIVGYSFLDLDYSAISTLCVLSTAWMGIVLIMRVSIPFTPLRAMLLAVVVGGIVLGTAVFRSVFVMVPLTPEMALLFIIVAICSTLIFAFVYRIFDRWHTKRLVG